MVAKEVFLSTTTRIVYYCHYLYIEMLSETGFLLMNVLSSLVYFVAMRKQTAVLGALDRFH